MNPLAEIVNRSFLSVFNEINIATEAWLEKSKLLTVGRNNYALFVANALGKFPLFGTTRFAAVEDAYVKVNVSPEFERERYKNRDAIERALLRQAKGARIREVYGQSPMEAMDSTASHFALLGNPGSGKTTAFRYIAVQLAKGHALRGRRRLPAYFAVRDMATDQSSITRSAIAFLRMMGVREATRVLRSLLQSGRLVVLLDGLDETAEGHQKRLLQELERLRLQYPNTILCVSSRPHSLSVALPGFEKWETLPLDLAERLAFVQKWFETVDSSKGQRLLAQSKSRPELLDLGSSPLLLSILCALYFNELDIPSESDDLYAQAVEGLLGRWDAFRNIARSTVLSQISLRRRVSLVSWMAASLFEAGRRVFSVREVEEGGWVEEASRTLRVDSPEVDALLQSLSNDFGILVERAPGIYSFSHLTLHEYLVAHFVVENRREVALLASHTSRGYFEVLRLVAKMLPDAVRFMTMITTRARLEDGIDPELRASHEIELLHLTWSAKPVLPPAMHVDLMRILAERVYILMRRIGAKFSQKNEVVLCEVHPIYSVTVPEMNLLFSILNESVYSYRELHFDFGGTVSDLESVRTVRVVGAEQRIVLIKGSPIPSSDKG